MKLKAKIAVLFLAVLSTTFAVAQEKKAASPATTATGTINGSTITINYSSPSVKGRTIWGELVPYGQVWRAGANDATTFQTSKAITVEGKKLAAGKYTFFVIPEKDGKATVIFNSQDKQWGAYKYDEKKDALRVSVKSKKSAKLNESLVYKVNKNNVTLSWEDLDFPISVK
jgi:hypothetical protein